MSRHLSPSLTSSSTPQRRTAAPLRGRKLASAAALGLTALLATGCSAGFDAASQQVHPNAGAGAVGDIKINNVWVVIDPATGNAEIIGSVANTGSATDTLESVSATNLPATVSGTDASAPTTGISVSGNSVGVPGGQSVNFGQAGNPELELSDAAFQTGRLSQVTFTFAQAGAVTVTAQVQPNNGQFAGYNPNPAVTATPPAPTTPPVTATATATQTGTATGSATSTATATGTPTPTHS